MICYGDIECLCEKCRSSRRAGSQDSRSKPQRRKPCSEPGVVRLGNGLPVPRSVAGRLQRSDQFDAELRELGLPGLDDLE